MFNKLAIVGLLAAVGVANAAQCYDASKPDQCGCSGDSNVCCDQGNETQLCQIACLTVNLTNPEQSYTLCEGNPFPDNGGGNHADTITGNYYVVGVAAAVAAAVGML